MGTTGSETAAPAPARAGWRVAAMAALTLALGNAAMLGLAWVFRQTVAPGWKKGPLIDPASPYAPENAMLLFAFAACVLLDVYVLLFAGLRARAGRPRAWMAAVAMLGAFTLAEGGVRAWLARDMVTYFRPHPTLHWVVRPGLRDFDNLTGGGRITTNADGLRDGPSSREAPPGTYRVLVLGDSSNFGHGVEGPETWARVLQDLVPTHDGKRVEVVNGATPGWTTYQAVEFLRTTGAAYAPDLVIAGFNNDPGPEYLGDAARVPGPLVRTLHGALFRSEVYLLGREVALAMARRVAGTASIRQAGDAPVYGTLPAGEAAGLVPRVPLDAFLANLRALHALAPAFAWIDMPIQREEPELVARYVNADYRAAAARLADTERFTYVRADARWRATRERGLFQEGHVFHPNARGHARLAQQVAREVLGADVPIEGPAPLADPATVRFGISSLTPVHAHVAEVLAAHPELPARHGLTLELSTWGSGKGQGEAVADGRLDAFFSCEVPAIRMLEGRPDAFVVGSPGELGRIAVVARGDVQALSALAGRRVGVTPGSTPAMDWETWAREAPGASLVPLDTDALQAALADGSVDAVVGWDPWVERWLREVPDARVVVERPFHSVLAVSASWAQEAPLVDGAPPAARLLALVEEALALAAREGAPLDARVAQRSGTWTPEIVGAVVARNHAWRAGTPDRSGQPTADPMRAVWEGLARAAAWARAPFPATALDGGALLRGERPPRRGGGKAPPHGGKVPPGPRPPGGPR